MPAKRLLAIFDLVAEHENSLEEHHGLCLVAIEVLRLSGAAIALTSKGQPWTLFCSSSETAQALMDLESTVGEGPCMDALALERLVEEADLSLPMHGRWPVYVPKALECGTHAVFALPVQIGVVRLGVLGLFREESGELSDAQATDAYLLASVVGQSLLAYQAGAPQGSLSLTLQREAMFDFSVQQATGMIAVQGGFSIDDALVALRSHAFAVDWGLKDLATEVISRRVRYEPDHDTWQHVGN
ncbi:MAG: hypothetical protein HIU84_05850 [Acidobacteria bacterium]|nr:hypothetical protein [Acidobacteriota bacterium]